MGTKNNSEKYELARKEFNGRLIGPYQSAGVRWMLDHEDAPTGPRGGMLCDEMGLGKTAQTIATMVGNPLPSTLIVVPKSLMTQWEGELHRFAPDLSVSLFMGGTSALEPTRVVICSYGCAIIRSSRGNNPREQATALHVRPWDRIILDEGHEIRNSNTKTHKSLCSLRSPVRWVLSGTPIFNSMKDLVGLCDFLGISKKLVQADPDKIREDYILRRTKEDVCHTNKRLELPPCDFENVELDMYPEERAVYDTAFMSAKASIDEIFARGVNIAAHNMEILECLLRVRQCMVHPRLYLDGMHKYNTVHLGTTGIAPVKEEFEGTSRKMEYLLGSISQHPLEKSLIFCQFITEMDIIQDMLTDAGIAVFRIDGGVSGTHRDDRLDSFRSHVGGCVFVIQVKAGGVGLNLQEATRVYITSPSWNPATELQAIGRSHRTGQTQKVIVRKLIYRGEEELPSVEQSIMELQESKSRICAEVLGDPRLETKIPATNHKNISIRAIRSIFSTTTNKTLKL